MLSHEIVSYLFIMDIILDQYGGLMYEFIQTFLLLLSSEFGFWNVRLDIFIEILKVYDYVDNKVTSNVAFR